MDGASHTLRADSDFGAVTEKCDFLTRGQRALLSTTAQASAQGAPFTQMAQCYGEFYQNAPEKPHF